ncbi:MAG TPA: RIP metalloprotease RseP [Clostridiales bacterium]|nr:RIP metalloprotease RseP [Clostridiales bacterium]
MNILLALAGLSLIILVHEIGHYLAARAFGIRVLEFSIFMGPRLWKKTVKGTDYSLRLIPFGGFVKMMGEEESSEDTGAFCKKPLWQRVTVTAAGALFNVIFALILFTLSFAVTGTYTPTIDKAAPGSPAQVAGIQPGDRLLSYNDRNFYAYLDFDILTYGAGDPAVKAVVRRGSEKLEFIFTPMRYRYLMGVQISSRTGEDFNLITAVPSADSPAAKAGIQAGDRILEINGMPVDEYADIAAGLAVTGEDPANLVISREGEKREVSLTPVKERLMEYTASGLELVYMKTWNPLSNLAASARMCVSMVRATYLQIAWLITGKASMAEVRGPVGIVDMIGEVVTEVSGMGWGYILISFVQLMAMISINIGIMQFLPLPALDGGRLLIQGVEGVRRKAITPEKEAMISYAGFMLFILLFLVVTFNDIRRWIGG